MKQIANNLGCSRTTVSLVLQGKGDLYRISKTTQEKITAYVQQSGFRPNYFASALNKNESKLIGAIFPDVFETFMGSIIRGLETVLYQQEYSLMVSTSKFNQHREDALLKTMIHRGVDGVILVPTMPFRHESPYRKASVDYLVRLNIPFVLVDRYIMGIDALSVLQKDYERSYHAVGELIRNGASHIACISFDLQASSIRDRIRGYQDALQEQGFSPSYILLKKQDPNSNDLHDALEQLLQSSRPPDAFFVTTAGLADKTRWLLSINNQSMPIAQFGNAPFWTAKNDITIPQPHIQMGEEAAKLLLNVMNGKPIQRIIRC